MKDVHRGGSTPEFACLPAPVRSAQMRAMGDTTVLEDQARKQPTSRLDDLAYVAPMAVFLILTWVGGKWASAYSWSYVLKTFLTPVVIALFWKRYTRIAWSHLGLGVIIGILGIVQWVGMEKLLLHFFPNYWRPGIEVFDPMARDGAGNLVHFSTAATMWSFIILRWAGATLVVPVMEELFWRDFLWRTIQSPNDFKLPAIGEWDPKAIFIVSAAFASVHIQWMTAFVWGLMIAWLLVRTRSIGACIVAHGVTNLLLGAYVQYTHDWYFW
jgi:CAAX prenyl protease-like protein